MPVALVYTIGAFTQVNFDANTSLKTGEFVFYSNLQFHNSGNSATTFPGIIVYNKNDYDDPRTTNADKDRTMMHEIIHIYQSNDFSILNTYYRKPINHYSENNKTISFLNKYLYLDLHYIPLRATYLLERHSGSIYYDNYFEHEAGYYSNTLR